MYSALNNLFRAYPRKDYSSEHAKAKEYKELCLNAGNVNVNDNLNGWNVIDRRIDQASNFRATAYQKDGKIVICYEGTNFKNIKDHGANLKMGILGKKTAQMQLALEYYREIKNKYPNMEIEVAGHSEGGSETSYVTLSTGCKGYAFNPYGLAKGILETLKENNPLYNESNIMNYCDPNDPVSKIRKLPGITFIVESDSNWFMSKTPLGSFYSHRLDNMGDVEKAVPINEYKNKHPEFLEEVNEMHFTDQNIIDLPLDVYDVFERKIDELIADNKVTTEKTAHQMALRGEIIFVQGYVRADGTQVKGYYRRLPA